MLKAATGLAQHVAPTCFAGETRRIRVGSGFKTDGLRGRFGGLTRKTLTSIFATRLVK